MKKLSHLPIFLLIAFFGMSCGKTIVIEEYQDITAGVWSVDSLASFDFVVEDTTLNYEIAYNVRYASTYPYYNLYVTYYLEDSTGNVLATELQDLTLFDRKSGEPLGEGLGDLFDREILIFDNYTFKTPAKYSFKVKQFMRMEELPGILSFGLRISEAETED